MGWNFQAREMQLAMWTVTGHYLAVSTYIGPYSKRRLCNLSTLLCLAACSDGGQDSGLVSVQGQSVLGQGVPGQSQSEENNGAAGNGSQAGSTGSAINQGGGSGQSNSAGRVSEGTGGALNRVDNDPSKPKGKNTSPPSGSANDQVLGNGFYAMENLDRGLVAVPTEEGIFLSWRMSGLEYRAEQPGTVAYNVYRGDSLLATVTDSTNLLDPNGSPSSVYRVALVDNDVEGPLSVPTSPWGANFLRVPLSPPSPSHRAHDSSLGDADGDGQYEIFLLWQPNNAQDNSNDGATNDVFIDALKLDGTRLWRINLGPNIRAGEHYTQFVVIDSDGDGKAEMGVKTAPGTVAGDGQYLSLGPAVDDDDTAEYRNAGGRILEGPEYFTIFDGLTGQERATVPFDPVRGNVNDWGDNYGNRVDRFLATAAYLDDTGLPSFVMARGYYTRTTLAAYSWREGELSQLWRFDSDETPRDASQQPYTGQGNHSLSVANVDDDNGQEIVYGAMVIDHDGTGKCSTGMNHGDALHVGDLIPERPGIEVFMPTESTNRPHWTVYDPNDCEIILEADQTGNDVGRGVAADVVADNPGSEFWASAGVRLSSATTGQQVNGPQPNSTNFLIWWDADELRELENGTSINKVGVGTLLSCNQCASNNGTKSVPTLVADMLGDWREEVIWREADNSALRIYTTTAITERRLFTLMHAPQYRAAISWQNVAYNQPPHPGFHLGAGMAPPAAPNIRLVARADGETTASQAQ